MVKFKKHGGNNPNGNTWNCYDLDGTLLNNDFEKYLWERIKKRYIKLAKGHMVVLQRDLSRLH